MRLCQKDSGAAIDVKKNKTGCLSHRENNKGSKLKHIKYFLINELIDIFLNKNPKLSFFNFNIGDN